ncbi:unnamed protein product [Vitrella brassicaformis CCMP3155]|uniref:Uncharacterized protein n=1 Tax=Vitrella brassicaformis (strain CCMP3155) TaxID=1169540 RepID=A0A0G4EH79_VITBC|nr:unnamed protein product [Vitrella brassicaformis CCMP3155]|eukprot:CEL95332.1 unnamed protein product [Vitrella brassicaformis CCMP3155]
MSPFPLLLLLWALLLAAYHNRLAGAQPSFDPFEALTCWAGKPCSYALTAMNVGSLEDGDIIIAVEGKECSDLTSNDFRATYAKGTRTSSSALRTTSVYTFKQPIPAGRYNLCWCSASSCTEETVTKSPQSFETPAGTLENYGPLTTDLAIECVAGEPCPKFSLEMYGDSDDYYVALVDAPCSPSNDGNIASGSAPAKGTKERDLAVGNKLYTFTLLPATDAGDYSLCFCKEAACASGAPGDFSVSVGSVIIKQRTTTTEEPTSTTTSTPLPPSQTDAPSGVTSAPSAPGTGGITPAPSVLGTGAGGTEGTEGQGCDRPEGCDIGLQPGGPEGGLLEPSTRPSTSPSTSAPPGGTTEGLGPTVAPRDQNQRGARGAAGRCLPAVSVALLASLVSALIHLNS